MGKKSHRDGGKFRGTHTTVIEAALPVVDALVKLEEVTGISLAMISQSRHTTQGVRVTHKRTISGLEVKVCGNRAVQTFYVYTGSPEAVEAFLDEQFPPPPKKSSGRKRGRRKGRVVHADDPRYLNEL